MPSIRKTADMLLEVSNLSVTYRRGHETIEAVRDVSFALSEGETLGIVGESGSGKTQAVMAVLGLTDSNGTVAGSAKLRGEELIGLAPRQLNRFRGRRISMIFQDPMTSLNPHLRIGTQMTEVLRLHQGINTKAAQARSIEMLGLVRINDPARRIRQYPHELSGGMRQRVMTAMSLLCEPDILIADEPTTALDVTVQAEILALMRGLRERFDMAMVLITHDLGIVAGTCDRVLVMDAGQIVESGDAESIFYAPQQAYTRALLAAVPRLRP
ncbi:MAG: ABC transporter ATP-binding protein [Acidobacteria bacterium]|nr:ABC transporter ATP-binding protein [Acidobacteriota bacterium]